MPGIITRRVPKRSSSQPKNGRVTAVQSAASNRALERSPRVIPSSALTGFRKTPDEKIRIGPAPTSRPQTDATTTNQRLAKRPPMTLPLCLAPLRPALLGFAYRLLSDPNDRNDI